MSMSSMMSAPQGGAPDGGVSAGGGAEPSAPSGGGTEPTTKAGVASEPAAKAGAPAEEEYYTFPEADSYAWDKWDGESFDGFDPYLQPWLQKAHATWGSKTQKQSAAAEAKLAEAQANASRWERLWTESLSEATTDSPHVREAMDKATAAENRAKRAEARQREIEEALAAHDKRIEAFVEEQSKSYEAWFQRAYPDIANDDARLNTLLTTAETLGEEWDTVAELMKMGDTAVKLAKEAKEQGLPSNLLMKWVQTNLKAAERDGVTRAAKSITDSQRLVAENADVAVPPPTREARGGGKVNLTDSIRQAVRESVKKRR